MKIETKEQFYEHVDALYKRGAKFNFDCCEVILLNSTMLMRDKNTMNRLLVDTRTGDCFWVYNEDVHEDNVLLENESEAWATLEIREACRNLPKHKAEKVMRVLEEKDDVGIVFAPATDIVYLETNKRYSDWQKQIMCGDMPCEQNNAK